MRVFLLIFLVSCSPKFGNEPANYACQKNFMRDDTLYDSKYMKDDGKVMELKQNTDYNIKPMLLGFSPDSLSLSSIDVNYRITVSTLPTKTEAQNKMNKLYKDLQTKELYSKKRNPIEKFFYELQVAIGVTQKQEPVSKIPGYDKAKKRLEKFYAKNSYLVLPEGISIDENGVISGKTSVVNDSEKLRATPKAMIRVDWSTGTCSGGASFNLIVTP